MITKELYKDCVQSIINFNKEDMEIYEVTHGIIDSTRWNSLLQLISQFELLLEYCTKDTNYSSKAGTNLSYFLYDLQGGGIWKPNSITDSEGNDIPCGNIEELWNNFILAEHPEIEDNENV